MTGSAACIRTCPYVSTSPILGCAAASHRSSTFIDVGAASFVSWLRHRRAKRYSNRRRNVCALLRAPLGLSHRLPARRPRLNGRHQDIDPRRHTRRLSAGAGTTRKASGHPRFLVIAAFFFMSGVIAVRRPTQRAYRAKIFAVAGGQDTPRETARTSATGQARTARHV